MFLKDQQTGALIKITHMENLANPVRNQVEGRSQAGEEEQPTATFDKSQLVFPSGEPLPQCWIDANYRADNA